MDGAQPAARQVHREARPGQAGDDDVVHARAGDGPRREPAYGAGREGERPQRRVGALRVAAELVLGRGAVDPHEPQHRVGLVAGQHHVDEGDPVARDVVAAAHVHGHHRLERSGLVAAAQQEGAQRARADREHGVVDRRAPAPAHDPQVVDRARGRDERAVGRRDAGQRAHRRPRDRGAGDRAAHPQRRARAQREPDGERDQRGALPRAVRGRAGEARATGACAAAPRAAAAGLASSPRPPASGRAARRPARARPRRRPCSGGPCRRCPRGRPRAPARSTCPTAGDRAAAARRAPPRPPGRACRRGPRGCARAGRSRDRPPTRARAGRAGPRRAAGASAGRARAAWRCASRAGRSPAAVLLPAGRSTRPSRRACARWAARRRGTTRRAG